MSSTPAAPLRSGSINNGISGANAAASNATISTSVVTSVPQPQTPGTPSQQNLNQIVLEYLSKKGYTKTEAMLRKESEASQITTTPKPLSPPEQLTRAYNLLLSYIDDSLVVYRPELNRLLWPVFVHFVLDLAEGYFIDGCSKFYDAYHGRFKQEHEDELRKLQVIRLPEHVQSSDFSKLYRSNKYRLTMSRMAYTALLQFLEVTGAEGATAIVQVLQKRMNIVQVDRAQLGSERSLAAMLAREGGEFDSPAEDEGIPGHNPGSANTDINAPSALPRIYKGHASKEPELMDDLVAELQEIDVAHPPTVGQPSLVEELDATIKREPVEDGPPRDMVPLPPSLARDVAMEVQKIHEHRDRFKIESRTDGLGAGISTLMYTFHNTKGTVNCLDFSMDLKMVAAGMANHVIRVWSLEGSPLPSSVVPSKSKDKPVSSRKLIGHEGPICAARFSKSTAKPEHGPNYFPDTKPRYIVSCSADKTIRLWSIDTWSCLVVYKSHAAPVWDVMWSPHGHYFASVGHDRAGRLWATDSISPLRMFVGHDSDPELLCWHPNGAYIFTAGDDKTVRMWDISTGRSVRMFTGHTGNPTALECAPNGKILASADDHGSILIWDIEKGARVKRMRGHGKGGIWSLSFSVESTVLVSGGDDRTVRSWDLELSQTDGKAAEGAQAAAPTTTTAGAPTGVAGATAAAVGSASTHKKKTKEAVTTPDQISAFPTKQSPVKKVFFTHANLLIAGSVYLPEMH